MKDDISGRDIIFYEIWNSINTFRGLAAPNDDIKLIIVKVNYLRDDIIFKDVIFKNLNCSDDYLIENV